MELLGDVELMRTVVGIGSYYPTLVKEFIVNMPSGLNKADSPDFRKIFVRGHDFSISPEVINEYLGRGRIIIADRLVQAIVDELLGCDDKVWPKNGLFPLTYLSAKYYVLYKIGISNWTLSSHGFGVTPALANLLYQMGTHASFDFGEFILDHLVKHAESYIVKLLIGSPSFITDFVR